MRTLEQQATLRAKNAAYQRAYRKTKTGKARLDAYQRSDKRRAVQWRKELKRCYGVTPEWYEAKLAAQNNGCAICGLDPDERRLAVDHHHTTGQIRGLLCARHNVMVGVLEHPDIPKLVAYLSHYGAMA
jgi:CRISPR/Cas system-associated protein Cas10 (large subunit of type III CRISPR-Cas system)